MDQTTLLIIVGVAALIIGILMGRLLTGPSTSSEKEKLHKELEAAQEELDQYKAQVTEHFSKTADLVNTMTESYKDVYRHLAQSAEQLGANEQFKLRLESDSGSSLDAPAETAEAAEENQAAESAEPEAAAADSDSKAEPEAAESEEVQAPRDYAPKAEGEDQGTLAEGYGLKDKNQPSGHAADHPKS